MLRRSGILLSCSAVATIELIFAAVLFWLWNWHTTTSFSSAAQEYRYRPEQNQLSS